MAKKKIDKDMKTLVEAISYTKSCREKAPSNPKLTEGLGRLENEFHNELYELLKQEMAPGN